MANIIKTLVIVLLGGGALCVMLGAHAMNATSDRNFVPFSGEPGIGVICALAGGTILLLAGLAGARRYFAAD